MPFRVAKEKEEYDNCVWENETMWLSTREMIVYIMHTIYRKKKIGKDFNFFMNICKIDAIEVTNEQLDLYTDVYDK